MKNMTQIEKSKTTSDNILFLVAATIFTCMILRFSLGISGNDFWWHIKIGEWIIDQQSIPKVGIYSWYALDHNLEWISHEWLSEVILFSIHTTLGNLGVFILSVIACMGLVTLIIGVNKEKILRNIALSTPFLLLSIIIFPIFFYGRPQIFSAYLLYFTLLCLYRFVRNQSKLIFLLPLISIFWSNLHGGSSNMPYVLCMLVALSGLFDFSYAHLEAERHSTQQTKTLLVIAFTSFLATAINPHGIKMLLYPYINMGDSMMLSLITEWISPDAKSFEDLITCFLPILFVSLVLLLTKNKIKLLDLLIFLLFAYLAFRSFRFIFLFYIATSFIVFEYLPPGAIRITTERLSTKFKYLVCLLLIVVNILGATQIYKLWTQDNLISVALDKKYITAIKKDNPKRLFNDYNYGEILIYNEIFTFVDARADLFSKTNLADAYSLLFLKAPIQNQSQGSEDCINDRILDVEKVIYKYKFDAFLIQSDRSLTAYLLSHPEKYILVMSDDNTSYFRVIAD